ncbi:hypothetical protein [Alkalihalobacterium chitinilyticum]|uniref:Lipoprotein n=1 Tax=Alkalihalobacterium chitinilyticum TaxID=2980103 RepID=A0ABT5VFN4_9BACI|nr:hypothetical protein [Alkalihalobacterium chitinilyticum]MDE5414262.1 hypothetical protein [Alkalihalobacterium chitinilyticum]
MKKLVNITIVTMLAFTLSACGNNVESNTIVNAELTDREKGILLITSDQSFVFDFNIDSEYTEASVWIEKYEFGKLVDEQTGPLISKITNNGSIIFTITESEALDNQQLFNIGISSDGGAASLKTFDTISIKGTDGMSSVWGSINEEMDIINENLVLASIRYSWGEGSMGSLSSEFYKDVEGQINEIENFEVVYLLRSKFTK